MITSSHKLDSLRAINHGLGLNPFENAVSFLIVVCSILLAAYCIYRFDLHILKRAGLSEEQGRKSALWLAVTTAPYLFLLPSELLFRWMRIKKHLPYFRQMLRKCCESINFFIYEKLHSK